MVVLAEPPPAGPPPGPREGPVAGEIIRVEATTLSATVMAPRDGMIVVVDPMYPGWSATLDGKPVPILRANHAFQAIPVPAGRHDLLLTYRNRWLAIGAVVSSATLVLLIVALTLRNYRIASVSNRSG